jgi:hypothetical protein
VLVGGRTIVDDLAAETIAGASSQFLLLSRKPAAIARRASRPAAPCHSRARAIGLGITGTRTRCRTYEAGNWMFLVLGIDTAPLPA